ncbi:HD domain-containing phosphohydrolase [Acetobacterium woodii]|uniref:Response regulator receiver modulated metal dependent phosphohydrolase n=1 Tax=Acetobacterium woodii (strain ATCC 29683 / DSM 1030 / JCM 2381 / KCTC 1655 / WB1) TaxID=931626 RepID=H6LGD6_ACEWD|nr:HD domain-containing phosphohydrolase [Acetobacterium woodii]AFA47072.1 response regulator receiver modulated metal dependent phosphohydrolase [Acetobacterium woodii DSM 1030]
MYEVLYSLYSAGLIISIICIIGVALQKPTEEQKIMLLITFFAFLLSLGYWFNVQSNAVDASIIAYKLMYLGGSSLYFLFVLFFVRYYKIKPPLLLWVFWGILGIVFAVAILTMDHHHWFYQSYSFAYEAGVPILIKEYGALHTVYIIMEAAVSVGLVSLVIYQSIKRKDKDSWEPFLLLMVPLIPTLIHIGGRYLQTQIDLVSIGILMSEMLLIILIYRLKIYDINDTAKQLIIDSMDDAIVVVDQHYLYKEANEQAIVLFPELAKAKKDTKLAEISNDLEQTLKSEDPSLFYRDCWIYEPRIKTIHRNNQIRGYVIWYLDVTESEKRKALILNYQQELEKEVQVKTARIEEIQEQIIVSFANIIEMRDTITGEHARRTSIYAEKVATVLYQNGDYPEIVDQHFIRLLRLAAPLHDVGKILIPDNILNKPGKLTEDEWVLMKKHAENGQDILKNALSKIQDVDYLKIVCEVAMYHHERWIGTGYPEALSGEAIPLSARIMAIADVFDALTSERSYKDVYDYDTAFEIIKKERGLHFDPILVDAFLSIRKEIEAIAISETQAERKDEIV